MFYFFRHPLTRVAIAYYPTWCRAWTPSLFADYDTRHSHAGQRGLTQVNVGTHPPTDLEVVASVATEMKTLLADAPMPTHGSSL